MKANVNGFKATKEELNAMLMIADDVRNINAIEIWFKIENSELTATKLVDGAYSVKAIYCSIDHDLTAILNAAAAKDGEE